MSYDHEDCQQLEGKYANYFRVGHNTFEFVIDFGQFYLENTPAQLHTRIITSPAYIKALCETMRESLDKYERDHGAIGDTKESRGE